MRYKIKVPATVPELRKKGEHFFHSIYIGAEAVVGHGYLQVIAGVTFFTIIIAVFITPAEDE